MLILIFSIVFILSVAFYSTTHALGIWLVMMITHGLIVTYFGDIGIHLPFYVGISILAVLMVKKELRNFNYELLILTLILLLLMVMSALAGLNQTKSIIYISLYAKGVFLALIIAATVVEVKNVKILSMYCLGGLVFGALVTVYQYKTGNFSIDGYYLKRAGGLRKDPNDTAMLLLSGLSISVYWLYKIKSRLIKLVPLFSGLLLLVGIALTNSRGGFVTLVFIGFVLYAKKPSLKNTISLVAVVVLIGLLAPQTYWDRMESLVTGQEQHGGKSMSSRVELLKRGGLIFLNNPVLGVGSGNFGSALQLTYTDDGGSASAIKSRVGSSNAAAHNMYLEFFSENGFVTGLLFLYILFKALMNYYNFDKFRHSKGVIEIYGLGFALSVAILAMLFASMFLSQGKNSVLWFLVGIAFSAACIKRPEHTDVESDKEKLKPGTADESVTNKGDCQKYKGVTLR